MKPGARPSYDLKDVKKRVASGDWVITRKAMEGASGLGMDRHDIADCVAALGAADFHKTMASELRPGTMQDVYRPRYSGHRLYVKVQVTDCAVVISFKQDESR